MREQGPPEVSPVSRVSRAVARRLADEHGSELETQVAMALYVGDSDRPSGQYLDPVSLSSLIVSTASLSWTVYKDLRAKKHQPTREQVGQRVRIELSTNGTGSADQIERNKVIEIVVDEIVSAEEH